MEAELETPSLPREAEVSYSINVRFNVNVTAFSARQKVNVYLLTHVGNMLSAGKPKLMLGTRPRWDVPVYCAFPDLGERGCLGLLAVCPETGDLLLDQSSLRSPAEIERRASTLHDSLTAA